MDTESQSYMESKNKTKPHQTYREQVGSYQRRGEGDQTGEGGQKAQISSYNKSWDLMYSMVTTVNILRFESGSKRESFHHKEKIW